MRLSNSDFIALTRFSKYGVALIALHSTVWPTEFGP